MKYVITLRYEMTARSMNAPGDAVRALIVFIAVIAVTGCPDRGPEQFPAHEKPAEMRPGKLSLGSHFRQTDGKQFWIALSIREPGAAVGTNHADILLRDMHDAPLPGADISLVPWMPGMGHGVRETPLVTDRGGGRYGADNIVFNMEGYWELRVRISVSGLEDTVVFTLPDVKER